MAARPCSSGRSGDAVVSRLSPISETHWKSRIFTVEPEPGFRFSFWAWADPVKGKPVALEGDLSAAGMKFAVVVSRWNAVVTDRLLEGALDALLRSGADRSDIEVIRVPGAWEIPAAARAAANTGRVDAIVTLGCLLRGETAHYEAIYNEVARGIGQSQQETGIPHSFGVLTCETLEQALNRAGIKAGNKGFEAAAAAIEMVSLRRKVAAGRSRLTSRHRRKSRELAMQMLFQADVGHQTADQVRATFWKAGDPVEPEVRGFAEDLFRVAQERQEEIDALIASHSTHWRLDRMPAVDRNLLRMAVAELLGFKSTPFPVVINEALEIGRRYCALESSNFLNGVLDSIARDLIPK